MAFLRSPLHPPPFTPPVAPTLPFPRSLLALPFKNHKCFYSPGSRQEKLKEDLMTEPQSAARTFTYDLVAGPQII